MKKVKLHPSTLILLPALIVIFSFTSGSINAVAGGPGKPASDSTAEAIQRVAMQIKDAYIRGDSSLYVKTYTPDGCILAPNGPTLCGQRGLIQFYKNARKAGIRDAAFTSLGLYGETADFVTEQGVFEVFDANDHPLARGKVINIWKKTDQGWRLFRQMLNFDSPAPTPPTSSPK